MGVGKVEFGSQMFEGSRLVLKAYCSEPENYMNDRGLPDKVKLRKLQEKAELTGCAIRPRDKTSEQDFWFDLLIPCKSQWLLSEPGTPGQADL